MAQNKKKMPYTKYMDRYKKNGNGMKKNGYKKNGNGCTISKDYSAPANMPQNSKMAMYDRPYGHDDFYAYDSLESQDAQIRQDAKEMWNRKGNKKYPEKY